jgi:acyl-CoA synthetase (AMP-forming)/AMP-acid ligase II
MGVKRGDRVGVIMGNNRYVIVVPPWGVINPITSAYAMLQWACASIGAILVTVNPAYRSHELVGEHLMRLVLHRNLIEYRLVH